MVLAGLMLSSTVVRATQPAAAPGGPSAAPSAFQMMSPQLQAMQRDDGLNPGMLWVLEGQALWTRAEGATAKSCASCHGDTPAERLRGAAATYPAIHPRWGGGTRCAGFKKGRRQGLGRSRHGPCEYHYPHPQCRFYELIMVVSSGIAEEGRSSVGGAVFVAILI
jgi:hypothetical protein